MHNPERTEYVLEKLRGITIRAEAHARIRSHLEAYADFHAVPETRTAPAARGARGWAPLRSWYAAASGALVVVLMTGTTFAAEKALPGDTLYPLKVRVTEPVQVALTPTPVGKAKVHTALAERRLQEAEVLAVSQSLDEDTQEYLQHQFSKHVDSSLAAAEKLKESGKTVASLDARSSLEASLVAHEDILDEVEDHLEDVAGAESAYASARELREAVEVRQEVVRDTRVALEKDVDEGTDSTDALAAITKASAAVPKVEKVAEKAAAVPALEPVARRVADAEEALQEAKESVESSDPEDTRRALRKAREAERTFEVASVLAENTVVLTAIATPAASATTTATTTPATAEATSTQLQNLR